MRIITLEEHVTFPEFTKRIPEERLKGNSLSQSPMIEAFTEAGRYHR